MFSLILIRVKKNRISHEMIIWKIFKRHPAGHVVLFTNKNKMDEKKRKKNLFRKKKREKLIASRIAHNVCVCVCNDHHRQQSTVVSSYILGWCSSKFFPFSCFGRFHWTTFNLWEIFFSSTAVKQKKSCIAPEIYYQKNRQMKYAWRY